MKDLSKVKHDNVAINNILLFQKGPLSQWWGAYKGQESTFKVGSNQIIAFKNTKCGQYLDAIYEPFVFNCAEQWMMANKATMFDDLDSFLAIMEEKNPKKQKELGRGIANYKEDLWSKHRFKIILRGNKLKFEQSEQCREYLLQFNCHTIFAEASSFDKIWGIGLSATDERAHDIYQWQGLNLLGEVIRTVRQDYP